VSFTVSQDHYPIYLKDSVYNTDYNFDAGMFDLLQVKINQAGMNISTFMHTFSSKEDATYVFGDSQAPTTSFTIIKVSSTLCPF
jgi:hypothetical protein